MSIYQLLKDDHKKVQNLMKELLSIQSGEANRKELIEKIRDELVPHSRAEESVFYNSLRSLDAGKGVVLHAYQEHIEAEALLKLLQVKDKVDADWRKTAEKLQTALDHHIQEEEHKIFNVAKEVFTEEEASQLGRAFDTLKPEIRKKGFLGTSMALIENLMPPRFMKAFHKKDDDRHGLSA